MTFWLLIKLLHSLIKYRILLTDLLLKTEFVVNIESVVLSKTEANERRNESINETRLKACFMQNISYSAPPLLWDTIFYTFSLLNLHQIKNPMVVLKSAYHEDSETPPTS